MTLPNARAVARESARVRRRARDPEAAALVQVGLARAATAAIVALVLDAIEAERPRKDTEHG